MFDSLLVEDALMVRLVRRLGRGGTGLARRGLNLLFPPRCARCDADLQEDQDGLLLCADCRMLLGPERWPCCRRCGAAGAGEGDLPGDCDLCRDTPLKFDTVIPLGIYQGEMRKVVLRMKRLSQESLSAAMGRLLGLRRGPLLADLRSDLIVPVPMYWTRRLRRGTNSPEILAEHLGRYLNLPVRRRLLWRCRNTLPQAGLPPKRRFQNVRGAFRVRTGYHLEGARVLLVDDVLTTGATCSEAAGMLKQAGAAMVAAAVVARSQGPHVT